MGKFIFIFILVFLFLGIRPAQSEEASNLLHFSGVVAGDIYVPTNNYFPDKPLQELSTYLKLQADASFNEHFSARASYRGDGFDGDYSYITSRSPVTHLESSLREGYFDYAKEGFEIREGTQIISWGKSDAVNPTDFMGTKNFAFFRPEDEDRRLSTSGIWTSFTPEQGASKWNFNFVWTFRYPRSEFLIPPGVLPPGVSLSDADPQILALNKSEWGAKVAYSGTGWDIEGIWFYGFDHRPEIEEITHASIGPFITAQLKTFYPQIHGYGVNASLSAEKWVYRFESAYVVTPNDDGTNPLLLPSHLDAILGLERPLWKDFRGQVQLITRYFPRFTDPASATGPDPVSAIINSQIAQANALLLQYQYAFIPSTTLRLSYAHDASGAEAEIFYLQNWQGQDALLRPSVGYAWTDSLKSSLGSDIYLGPANRPLGALHPFTSLFSEVRYTF